MAIKVSRLRATLWAAATALTALSFPIQVYANSPLPSLLAYVVIGAIVAINLTFPLRHDGYGIELERNPRIDTLVAVYVLMILFDCAWQAALGLISPSETISAIVNYVLPVVWYRYFRRHGSQSEVRAVIAGMFVAGLIVSIYFVYDSYLKLALMQVGSYAQRAFQYSIHQAGGENVADLSTTRIALGYRSFGLLETHSVSGAWVIFGALAGLTLTSRTHSALRRVIVLAFGSMLLVGLNFTSLIAFLVIVVLFEFGGLDILSGRFSTRVIANALWLVALLAILIVGVLRAVGSDMAQFVITNVMGQRNLAFGTGGVDTSMVDITLNNIRSYLVHLAEFPASALFGDGYASYGGAKGGDIGWIESLSRMGLLLFGLIGVGLIRLVFAGTRAARRKVNVTRHEMTPDRSALLEFAVCVTLTAMIMDLHYSVWPAKSVLPFVFFALALFSRYLPTLSSQPAVVA